jgi:cardiolipin synthase
MAARIEPQSAQLTIEVAGNRLVLLPDGPDRLESLINLVDGAARTLRFLFYMFKADGTGHRVRDALIAARARGVEVSLLIDGFGSEDTPDAFFQPLIDSGCRFCRFEPRWGRRYLLRNHQKFVLADTDKVISGGFNIADDYFGTVEEGAWRDLGFMVEGPGAACLARYYDELFVWARSSKRQFRSLRRLLERHSQKDGPMRWLLGGPTRRLSPWGRMLKSDMMHGRQLDVVAAYFAPNRGVLRRITALAKRGAARLIMAAKSDNGATIGAARYTYSRLLRSPVEIYEYQPAKLHTKLIVVDDIVHIGSANLDMRSLYLNLEIMLRIEDAAFARMMRRFIDGEVAASIQVSRAAHKRHLTWYNRLIWGLCYFVVAITDYNVSRRLNFGVRER